MEVGIFWFIRGVWFAWTLPFLIASLPFSWLTSFRGVILGVGGRGKIMESKRHSIPQKFFSHFYALAVAWTTLLLVTTWMYAYTTTPGVLKPFDYSSVDTQIVGGGSHTATWRSVFLLLLMEIQVLRRLYETIYVFNYSPSARMHIFLYLGGLIYYIGAPLSLCCECSSEVYKFVSNAVAEFIVKGKNYTPTKELDWWEFMVPLVKLRWFQWVGAGIFFWGWIHQFRCHAILGSLRKNRKQSDEYLIPSGDWFENVSAPHYLAEIVLYSGILIASGGTDLTIWLLLVLVVSNLVFSAAETQRWYLQKFENYPRNRLAIIPFLY